MLKINFLQIRKDATQILIQISFTFTHSSDSRRPLKVPFSIAKREKFYFDGKAAKVGRWY